MPMDDDDRKRGGSIEIANPGSHGAVPVSDALRSPHRTVDGRRVVLGINNQQAGHRKPGHDADDQVVEVKVTGSLPTVVKLVPETEQPVHRRQNKDERDHRLAMKPLYSAPITFLPAKPYEEGAGDRGDDADRTDQQRSSISFACVRLRKDRAQQHCRDRGHCIVSNKSAAMPAPVTDIVTHIVSDDGGVARSSSGCRLDLPHKIGADVGALGEDAAAQPAKIEISDAPNDSRPSARAVAVARFPAIGRRNNTADAEQPEVDHQHASDRAGGEGMTEPAPCPLVAAARCAHWPVQDIHCTKPRCRTERADDEPERDQIASVTPRMMAMTTPTTGRWCIAD